MSSEFEIEARGTAIRLGESSALANTTRFNRIQVRVRSSDSWICLDFFSRKKQELDLFTEKQEDKPNYVYIWDLEDLPCIKEIMKRYRAWKVDHPEDLNFSLVKENNDSLFWLTTTEKVFYLVVSDVFGNGLEKVEIDREYEKEFIDRFLKLE